MATNGVLRMLSNGVGSDSIVERNNNVVLLRCGSANIATLAMRMTSDYE